MMPIPDRQPLAEFDFFDNVLRASPSIPVSYQRWDSLSPADMARMLRYFGAAVDNINNRAEATQDVLTALIEMRYA